MILGQLSSTYCLYKSNETRLKLTAFCLVIDMLLDYNITYFHCKIPNTFLKCLGKQSINLTNFFYPKLVSEIPQPNVLHKFSVVAY